MTALIQWFASPAWAQAVKALLHSVWLGALIAAVLALLLRKVSRPAIRYRLASTALIGVAVGTVVIWAAMNLQTETSPRFPPDALNPEPFMSASTPVARTPEQVVVMASWSASEPTVNWTAWLALVWMVGAGVMLGRAGFKIAGAERLRRSCRALEDPRISGLVAEARRAVRLTRTVRIAVTERLTSPAVVGVLVPTLILPLTLLTTLSPEQIRFILLHELAHIRRGDYLASLLQLLIEAMLFFNPAVWWISRQVRQECEACCDALAIELGGAPVEYAQTLVSVGETMLNPTPAAATAFGNGREPSSLADRVQRLLLPGYRPSLRLTWRAILAALLAGGVLLSLLAVGTREMVAATATAMDAPRNDLSPVAVPNSNLLPGQPHSDALSTVPSLTNVETGTSLKPIAVPRTDYIRFDQHPLRDPIVVEEDGSYSWNGMTMSLDQILGVLRNYETNAYSRMVLVKADQNAPFKPTFELVDSLDKLNLITFRWPPTDRANLHTRTFRVNAGELLRSTAELGPVGDQSISSALQKFFARIGADLQPPKSWYYNESRSTLMVRASEEDLDMIESTFQVLNEPPMQVSVRAHFVEVPATLSDELLREYLTMTNGEATGSSILTEVQADTLITTLRKQRGVRLLGSPTVTLLSGRQAQIKSTEVIPVVTGMVSKVTNGSTINRMETTGMEFGQVLDVVPSVLADGYTINMTLIPTITEFMGYESPNSTSTEAASVPRFRARATTVNVDVLDGQTVVLGGLVLDATKFQDMPRVLGDVPYFGGSHRSDGPRVEKKNIVVFVTPTLIDPAGSRVHPDNTRHPPPQPPKR